MNTQFYEFEARQKVQSALNEAKHARLLGEPSTHQFNLGQIFQKGYSQLQRLLEQVRPVTSPLNTPVVAEQGGCK